MISIHPGNYYLGVDLSTGELVRLDPVDYLIPRGCIRIKRLRWPKFMKFKRSPYKDINLPMLLPEYWSLHRVRVTFPEQDDFGV